MISNTHPAALASAAIFGGFTLGAMVSKARFVRDGEFHYSHSTRATYGFGAPIVSRAISGSMNVKPVLDAQKVVGKQPQERNGRCSLLSVSISYNNT
jgi:hypothetical protein